MKNNSRRLLRDNLEGYAFILPALIGLIVFYLYPIFSSVYYSMTNWDLLSAPQWVGLDNYRKLFGDEVFILCLINTLKWVAFYVPISILVSFVLALALEKQLKGIGIFRTIFYMPVVSPLLVVALLFLWLYNTEFGLINYIFSLVGLPKVGWLTDTRMAMYSVALMYTWKMAGFNMIILLAGLKGIPASIYEASEIDGISRLKKIWYIKLPLLTPAFYFVAVYAVIQAFQVFAEVYNMTRGGPENSTQTLVYYLYTNAFTFNEMGYASTIAVFTAALIMVVTVAQRFILGKNVQYDL